MVELAVLGQRLDSRAFSNLSDSMTLFGCADLIFKSTRQKPAPLLLSQQLTWSSRQTKMTFLDGLRGKPVPHRLQKNKYSSALLAKTITARGAGPASC